MPSLFHRNKDDKGERRDHGRLGEGPLLGSQTTAPSTSEIPSHHKDGREYSAPVGTAVSQFANQGQSSLGQAQQAVTGHGQGQGQGLGQGQTAYDRAEAAVTGQRQGYEQPYDHTGATTTGHGRGQEQSYDRAEQAGVGSGRGQEQLYDRAEQGSTGQMPSQFDQGGQGIGQAVSYDNTGPTTVQHTVQRIGDPEASQYLGNPQDTRVGESQSIRQADESHGTQGYGSSHGTRRFDEDHGTRHMGESHGTHHTGKRSGNEVKDDRKLMDPADKGVGANVMERDGKDQNVSGSVPDSSSQHNKLHKRDDPRGALQSDPRGQDANVGHSPVHTERHNVMAGSTEMGRAPSSEYSRDVSAVPSAGVSREASTAQRRDFSDVADTPYTQQRSSGREIGRAATEYEQNRAAESRGTGHGGLGAAAGAAPAAIGIGALAHESSSNRLHDTSGYGADPSRGAGAGVGGLAHQAIPQQSQYSGTPSHGYDSSRGMGAGGLAHEAVPQQSQYPQTSSHGHDAHQGMAAGVGGLAHEAVPERRHHVGTSSYENDPSQQSMGGTGGLAHRSIGEQRYQEGTNTVDTHGSNLASGGVPLEQRDFNDPSQYKDHIATPMTGGGVYNTVTGRGSSEMPEHESSGTHGLTGVDTRDYQQGLSSAHQHASATGGTMGTTGKGLYRSTSGKHEPGPGLSGQGSHFNSKNNAPESSYGTSSSGRADEPHVSFASPPETRVISPEPSQAYNQPGQSFASQQTGQDYTSISAPSREYGTAQHHEQGYTSTPGQEYGKERSDEPGISASQHPSHSHHTSGLQGAATGAAAGAGLAGAGLAGTGGQSGERRHSGPGHGGSKVLHQCTNCGHDNDITHYFSKEAVYRLNQ